MQVNVHEAKTHLSRLLQAVEAGEDVVIARDGRPVARLVLVHAPEPRPLGLWRGRLELAPDFDDLPEDIADAFGA